VPLILLLQFIATFAFANFEGTLSILTQVKWDYDVTENGQLFSYVGLCLLVFQGGIVRRLMPRVGELNFVVAGCSVLMLGLLLVGFAGSTLVQVLGALAVAVLGFSMLTPSLSSLLSRRTPAALQGEVLGIGQSMLALARVLGPAVGNPLLGIRHPAPGVTTADHPEWPYWVGAGVMFGALICGVVLRARPAPEYASAGEAAPS
jgi:MFS transporter, DHA1 family, tetracycline resistance protein